MLIRNARNRYERTYRTVTTATRGGIGLNRITPAARRLVGPAMR